VSVVVKIMIPCEIATPGKSRGSWDHRLGLIQQISPNHLATKGYECGSGPQSSPASTIPTITSHSNQLQLGRYM